MDKLKISYLALALIVLGLILVVVYKLNGRRNMMLGNMGKVSFGLGTLVMALDLVAKEKEKKYGN